MRSVVATIICAIHASAFGSGGLLVDEQGGPVANAQLLSASVVAGIPPSFLRPGFALLGHSDASGRWILTNAPERLWVVHPQFARQAISRSAGVCVLRRGGIIKGLITSPDGKPLEGARILGADFPVWTPSDGKFSISSCPPGKTTLVIEAPGCAATMHVVTAGSGSESLAICQVNKPVLRTLQLVDEAGRPVEGAEVKVERWAAPTPWDWQWRSDSTGMISWASGPAEPVDCSVSREGFERIGSFQWNAATNAKVTLNRLRRFEGRVFVPAGSSLGNYAVIVHEQTAEGMIKVSEHRFNESSFVVALPSAGTLRLSVAAEGYQAAFSSPIQPNVSKPEGEFNLRAIMMLEGLVHDSQGEPVTGAEIALAGSGERVVLGQACFAAPLHQAASNARGEFRVAAPHEYGWLFAVHPLSGFASTELRAGSPPQTVRLMPWSEISGVAAFHDRPLSDHIVAVAHADNERLAMLANRAGSRTGTDGSFRLKFVPPGLVRVGLMIRGTISHAVTVKLEPGSHSKVDIISTGAAVTGRLKAQDGDSCWFRTQAPAGLRRKTEDGFERTYAFEFEESGAFHVDAVPPGAYELEAHWHEPAPDDGPERCRGIWRTNVYVPDTKLLDLGTLIWKGENG